MTSIEPRGLVAIDAGTDHLVGAECEQCATQTFPTQDACPRCGSVTRPVALPAEGTLWSWTVQRIRPKPPYDGPDDFEPYAVGYVDLGAVKVEGRLDGREPDTWSIGTPVRLVVGEPDEAGDVWRYRWVATEEVAS